MSEEEKNGTVDCNNILDYLNNLILAVDLDCKIKYANQAAKDFFNDQKTIIGEKYCSVIGFVNRDCPVRRIVKLGEKAVEKSYFAKEEDYFEIINQPIFDVEGNLTEVIVELVNITELKVLRNQISYTSHHDELTGLYNRRFIEEEINKLEFNQQLPISAIVADCNGLKLINDSYGYQKGDQALRRMASILEKCSRKNDLLARWGGDEFLILMPYTEKEEAQEMYDLIKDASRKTKEEEIPISIAMGIAVKKKPEVDLFDIVKKAEENMTKNKLSEKRSAKSHILNALLKTLSEKSNETEEHALRMQKSAFLIGEKINLSYSELDKLTLLATLHDIGKTIIPAEILTKPDRLTDEEWKIMQQHPITGFRIASSTEEFSHVAELILSHHERWDGSGYPRGLKGEGIPLLARIITIVDAYDVMTNGRPYKEPMSKEEALEELKRCAGTQFDPELVEHFIEIEQD